MSEREFWMMAALAQLNKTGSAEDAALRADELTKRMRERQRGARDVWTLALPGDFS